MFAKYIMAAIDDIQQALNAIRQHTDEADWQLRLQALELMLSTSQSVVARARQLAEPKVKTRTVTVPKPKTVRRYVDVPKPHYAVQSHCQHNLQTAINRAFRAEIVTWLACSVG